jgi:hypothetical protein
MRDALLCFETPPHVSSEAHPPRKSAIENELSTRSRSRLEDNRRATRRDGRTRLPVLHLDIT